MEPPKPGDKKPVPPAVPAKPKPKPGPKISLNINLNDDKPKAAPKPAPAKPATAPTKPAAAPVKPATANANPAAPAVTKPATVATKPGPLPATGTGTKPSTPAKQVVTPAVGTKVPSQAMPVVKSSTESSAQKPQPSSASGPQKQQPSSASGSQKPTGNLVVAPAGPGRSGVNKSILPSNVSGRLKAKLAATNLSAQVEGLDKVADRAEKVEARQEKKKKQGKDIMMNEAVHVDDTGRRWASNVLWGLVGILVLAAGTAFVLGLLANKSWLQQDPAQASLDTSLRLLRLAQAAVHVKPFAEGESVSEAQMKAAILNRLEENIKQLQAMDKHDTMSRRSDPSTKKSLRLANEDRNFTDAWGQPLVLAKTGENVFSIKAANPERGKGTIFPVQFEIPREGGANKVVAPVPIPATGTAPPGAPADTTQSPATASGQHSANGEAAPEQTLK